MTVVRRRNPVRGHAGLERYEAALAEHEQRIARSGYTYETLCLEAELTGLVVTFDGRRLAVWDRPAPPQRSRVWRAAHRLMPVGWLYGEVPADAGNLDRAAVQLRAVITANELLPELGVYTWDELDAAL